jgi:hypothetical protein
VKTQAHGIDPLDSAGRIQARAWNADGLAELTAGLLFLCVGAGQGASFAAGPESEAGRRLSLALGVGVVGFALSAKRLLGWFRNRFLAARGGHFVPRAKGPHTRKGAVTGVAAALLMTVVAASVMRGGDSPAVLTAFGGLFGGGILSWTGWSAGIGRLKAAGALVIAWGLGSAPYADPIERGLALGFGGSGLILLVPGLIGLRRFLRETEASCHTPIH